MTHCTNRHLVRERRAALLAQFGGKCSSCGFGHPAALEFHHLDPSAKAFKLSGQELEAHAWADVLREAEKCVLLCSNCHRVRHADMRHEIDLKKEHFAHSDNLQG